MRVLVLVLLLMLFALPLVVVLVVCVGVGTGVGIGIGVVCWCCWSQKFNSLSSFRSSVAVRWEGYGSVRYACEMN